MWVQVFPGACFGPIWFYFIPLCSIDFMAPSVPAPHPQESQGFLLRPRGPLVRMEQESLKDTKHF